MKREIKFRGKRLDNGEWVYGCLYYFNYESNPKNPVRCFIAPINQVAYVNGEAVEEWEVDPETVGRFTGLLDKNGAEIYEEDILRLWRSVGSKGQLRGEYGRPLPVEYSEQWCQFVVVDRQLKSQYGIWQSFGAFEVIGNIHKNPELIAS